MPLVETIEDPTAAPAASAWDVRGRGDRGVLRGSRASPASRGCTRARQVVEQRGTIQPDYTVARVAAASSSTPGCAQLFARREQITTFGPYSPGQAVALKRAGIEAIYLGGWATSAKGSATRTPGPTWPATR